MFRSLIAITVGLTALCFARVPQEQTKSGADPFGSSPRQSKEQPSEADPFGQATSPAKGESESRLENRWIADPSTASVTFVVSDGPGPPIELPMDPITQATVRLKQLEKEYKLRETQVIGYAASMHKKYTGQATFPIAVRNTLSKKIEATLEAREKLQRQRIHSARLRLDASEARLSKALTRSSLVVKRRVEQLLGKQPSQAATGQDKTTQPSSTSVASTIPPGMRVVTVQVNVTTSHGDLLSPGTRVDVMLTYQSRTEGGSVDRTRTLLQFIKVFAVGQTVPGETRNVSLLVTPEQGHLLVLAQKKGSIYLALRSDQAAADRDDEKRRVALEESINKVRADLAAREQEYATLAKSADTSGDTNDRISNLVDRVQLLRAGINQADIEVVGLNAKLSNERSENAAEKLQHEVKVLHTKISSLSSLLTRAEKELERVSNAKKMAPIQKEIERLRDLSRELSQEWARLPGQPNSSDVDIFKIINTAINNVEKDLQVKEDEYEEYRKSIAGLELSSEVLSDRTATIAKSITTTELEILRLTASIRTIEAAIKDSEGVDEPVEVAVEGRFREVPTAELALRLLNGELTRSRNRLAKLEGLLKNELGKLKKAKLAETKEDNFRNLITRLRGLHSELIVRLEEVSLQPNR